MTAGEAMRLAQLRFAPVAGEEAEQQSRLLMAAHLGVPPGALFLHRDAPLTPEALVAFFDDVARRETGEPLQYILGEWSFMGLDFFVSPAALIPRQDTEPLAARALELAKERGYSAALDLCTGTGCVAVSLAKLGGLAVTATDLSAEALALAEKNAARHGASIRFAQGDLFAPVSGRFDLITVNPPYLSDADFEALQQELAFEPRMALHGGADGLDFYRRIEAAYRAFLNPGGALLMEIGDTQESAAKTIFGAQTVVRPDLSGHPRVAEVSL